MSGEPPIPRATYRLQLNKDFRFEDAAALAPYLERLGISHVYLSPVLQARAGSTHGYDTVDHTAINSELGGIEAFRLMAAQFRNHGLGIVADFVPNHMGVGGSDNPYWLDVLESGESSRYAQWFDIDWHPAEPSLAGKLLAPVLGKPYGRALDAGDLKVKFDPAAGELALWAHEHHKLPLALPTYPEVLPPGLFSRSGTAQAESRDVAALKQRLKEAAGNDAVRKDIDTSLARLNDDPPSLDALIGRQHWRIAQSAVADDIVNYRRFFIVNDLAGIRIERDDVFDHAHRLIFSLIAEGLIDGLRIDHIDGLWDPKTYCLKLRQQSPRPIYIVVEKILAMNEALPADWRIEGTTGYEFSALVAPLLTDPASEPPLSAFYRQFSGETREPAELERSGKQRVMDHELSAELDSLSYALVSLARDHRDSRDFTRAALRRGLRAILAEMPAYRTYADDNGITPPERDLIIWAAASALDRDSALGAALLDFLANVMTVTVAPSQRSAALAVARRIQQFSGPVMAKGLEDTALYRYNRLICLNDVGERPDTFSIDVDLFHRANQLRLARLPHCMLSSSSHDSKRGEDGRARIAALSGHVAAWTSQVPLWLDLLRKQGAPEIDRNDVYLAFQMLVGAWPAAWGGSVPSAPALVDLRERLQLAMQKSIREARVHTTWGTPNETYEAATSKFVETMLATGGDNKFLAAFTPFVGGIAADGAKNGLIATVLKLTSPGVPDIYQGAEFWEQSMVDPDNRRPVDFLAHQRLLSDAAAFAEDLPDDWRSGAVKQRLIARILGLRQHHPRLFSEGTYEPIEFAGTARVISYRRSFRGQLLFVAAPLMPWTMQSQQSLLLPHEKFDLSWLNVLSGSADFSIEETIPLLARGLPVVLFRDSAE